MRIPVYAGVGRFTPATAEAAGSAWVAFASSLQDGVAARGAAVLVLYDRARIAARCFTVG